MDIRKIIIENAYEFEKDRFIIGKENIDQIITEIEQALQLHKTKVSGSYNWISVEKENPIAYITGGFDGKNSDVVLVKCKDGTLRTAIYNYVFMDGSEFEEWYCAVDHWCIDNVVLWTKICE